MARIVGIDLGTYSVKVVHLDTKARGGFDVVKIGEALVQAPAEGTDAHATLNERHQAALAELRAKGMLDGDMFVTGLPGETAALRTLRFPFSDTKKIAEALPFALESEIPLDLDEIVLSWAVLGPTARAKKEGAVPETEVLVAYTKKEAVQQHLDLLAVFDIDPRHVEFEPLALDDLYDAVFARAEGAGAEGPTELKTAGGTVIEVGDGAPEPAIAVVDIGHHSTSVCVLAGTRVVSAQTLLHGGADATRALARAIGLPAAEAERGKRKEAFIEVTGARAQFPEQQQISEVLKGAYAPIVRRLRQIFQASISQARVRVVKIVLVGGGSGILNLDRHLAEELNVKVHRGREMTTLLRTQLPLELQESGAPQHALALAYALSGVSGHKTRARIDFRTEEFAYKGDFDFLREKAPALGAWAAEIFVLFLFSGVARAWVLGNTEDELTKKELDACKQITGQELDSYSRCIAIIQEKINGGAGFGIPERSAVDTYLEIAHRLPPSSELKRKIVELDITNDRVKMRGTTTSYDAIDTMVEKLNGGRCFSLVEKGKAQNKADQVEFNITITLDCAAAPGDEKAQHPPEGKPARPSSFRTHTPPTPSPTALPSVAPGAPALDTSKLTPAQLRARGEAPSLEEVAAKKAAEAAGKAGEVPEGGTDVVQKPGRLSPEEIEERRERLRKLREERDQRRGRLGELPVGPNIAPRGSVRDRVRKTNLEGRDGAKVPDEKADEGEEE
jgi:general secretion pathway protein L